MSPASAAVGCDLTLKRTDLVAALDGAARIAKGGKPIAIYGSAYLEAQAGELLWWVSNTTLWRTGLVAADVAARGCGLLPVELAAAFLNKCTDEQVRLSFDGPRVTLTAGRFKVKLPALPAEDYPARPAVPSEGISLARTALLTALGHILPVATGLGATKYFTRGALFRIAPAALTCVVTDGHRMVRTIVPRAASSDDSTVDIIVPREALTELGALLRHATEATVQYAVVEGRHVFTVGDAMLTSLAIDDKYPAWERIIPTGMKQHLTCNRSALLAAVQRVTLACDGESMVLAFRAADGVLAINGQSAERGAADDQVSYTTHDRDTDVAFGLNGRYVSDFLQSLDCEAVTIGWESETEPIGFAPTVANDSDYYGVIMPMRL